MKNGLLRFTHYTLIVCVLTTGLGLSACRSDGIPVRSWDDAVAYAQSELDKAGDLESRLEGYADTAARLSAKIEVVEQARPALDAIQKLRDVQVPLVGDGWDILLFFLSFATVDGAKILGRLEETLRALADLRQSLDNLSGLTDTADAIRDFRADPAPRSLAAMADASATATPALNALRSELGSVQSPLKEVAGNLSGLVKGLQAVADAGILGVSDAAGFAAGRIGQIEGPLVELRDGLEQWRERTETDTKTLERIQQAVRKARKSEE